MADRPVKIGRMQVKSLCAQQWIACRDFLLFYFFSFNLPLITLRKAVKQRAINRYLQCI